jgi:hypothetical protein
MSQRGRINRKFELLISSDCDRETVPNGDGIVVGKIHYNFESGEVAHTQNPEGMKQLKEIIDSLG